jgi:hypothetical protein
MPFEKIDMKAIIEEALKNQEFRTAWEKTQIIGGNNFMKWKYDRRFDILDIFEPGHDSVCYDVYGEINEFRDMKTNAFTGIKIFDFLGLYTQKISEWEKHTWIDLDEICDYVTLGCDDGTGVYTRVKYPKGEKG